MHGMYGKDPEAAGDSDNDTLLPGDVGSKDMVQQFGWYHNYGNPVKLWHQGRLGKKGCGLALFATAYVFIVLIMVAWLGALGFITYVGFTHQGRPCDQPLAMWCVVFGLSSLVLFLGGMGCAGLMKLKERPAIITGTLAAGSIFVFSWLVVGAVRVFASGGTKACDPMLFHATQYLVVAMLSLLGLLVSSFCFCCSARSLGLFGAA